MLRKTIVISALSIIITLTLARAEVIHAPEGQILPQDVRSTINWTISRYAFVYGVDEQIIHQVVFCESSYNPNAQNITNKETSFGLSQINLKAHPTITKEQATDIDFAIRFMVKNISEGKGSMWTCYNKVKGV